MKNFINRTIVFTVLIISFLLTSCSNPADSDDHEHSDPEGLELIHDGEVHFRYFDGEVTEPEHYHYHVGEEYHFEVEFLDEDGDHIHAEDLDDSYSLGWVIEDENIFDIEQESGDGKWSFHLVPLAEGGSKVQFLLNHGDDHADFQTPLVTSADAIEIHIDAEGDDHEDDDH